jgi:hypothetical protein
MPPARDSITPSVSKKRAIRPFPAPRAVRMAISFWRATARLNRRVARLAQATSKTKPTAPRRRSRAGRTGPTITSCRGTISVPRPAWASGYSSSSCRARAPDSVSASVRFAPGARRPMTRSVRRGRSGEAAGLASRGIHTSTSSSSRNAAGSTPTTRYGIPTFTVFPTTSGSPRNDGATGSDSAGPPAPRPAPRRPEGNLSPKPEKPREARRDERRRSDRECAPDPIGWRGAGSKPARHLPTPRYGFCDWRWVRVG